MKELVHETGHYLILVLPYYSQYCSVRCSHLAFVCRAPITIRHPSIIEYKLFETMSSTPGRTSRRNHIGGGHDDDNHSDDGSSTGATIPQDRYGMHTDSLSMPTCQSGVSSVASCQTSEEEMNDDTFEDDDEDSEEHDCDNNDLSTQHTRSSDDGSSGTDDFSDMMTIEEEFGMDIMTSAFQAAHPSAGKWVDSACSWLDQPMCLLGIGKKASLLRQSKGLARSSFNQMRLSDALSQSGLSTIAMQRRSLRLTRIGISASGSESVAGASSHTGNLTPTDADVATGAVLSMTEDHIQLSSNKKSEEVSSTSKRQQKLDVVVETEGDEEEEEEEHEDTQHSKDLDEKNAAPTTDGSRLSPINLQSVDSDDALGDANTGAKNTRVTLSAELTGKLQDDGDLCKDADRLGASPNSIGTETNAKKSEFEASSPSAATLKAQSSDLSESESIESDAGDSTAPLASDRSRIPILSKRSDSPNTIKNVSALKPEDISHFPTVTKKVTKELPAAPAGANVHDDIPRKGLPKDVEVIDLQDVEDRQPWSHTSGKQKKLSSCTMRTTKPGVQERLVERDPSPSFSARRRAHPNQGREPSPSSRDRRLLSNKPANKFFTEDATRLSATSSKRNHANQFSTPAGITNPQKAEDLWIEEEKKLHIIPPTTDIFDDPEAREAFLGHRRGRLQEGSIRDERRNRSESRNCQQVDTFTGNYNKESVSLTGSKSREAVLDKTPEKTNPVIPVDGQPSRVAESSPTVATIPRRRPINELAAVKHVKDSYHLRSTVSREQDERYGESREPLEYESSGRVGRSNHQREEERPMVEGSKVRDNREHVQNVISVSNREDMESRQVVRSRRGPESWPDYETVISATKELKKLEKKIEKQLRTVRRETRNQEWVDGTSSHVSSKEIRKLEKQLVQKLKRENEKRGAKLKRIKRRSTSKRTATEESHDTTLSSQKERLSSLPPVAPSTSIKVPVASPMSMTTRETSTTSKNEISSSRKSFSQKVEDFRERSKFDQLRVLRSARYQRPLSRGQKTSTGIPADTSSGYLAGGEYEI